MKDVYHRVFHRAKGDMGDCVYPVSVAVGVSRFDGYTQYELFHLAAWFENNDITDFVVVGKIDPHYPQINTENIMKYVLFGKERDRLDYIEWRNRIAKWYVNKPMTDTFVPSLPLTGSISIHAVSYAIPGNPFGDHCTPELFRVWSWITHHCTNGSVWRIQDGFAFEDERDAVCFTLSQLACA